MATISSLYVKVLGDSTGLQRSLATASASLKAFGSTANTAGATATRASTVFKAGFVLAGVAAADAIGKGIAATQEWAGEVRSLQRVTGQTAEQASALAGGAESLGIGVDKLTVGFGLLSKNIVNGAPNLKKYGVTVQDASGVMLPFDSILDNVADKFVTLKKGPEQAAFAMNVFGRSGKQLIPILQGGAKGLDELRDRAAAAGLVMSQGTLDGAKALTIAQNELNSSVKGASITIGVAFLPIAKIAVDVLTSLVHIFIAIPGPIKTAVFAFVALTGALIALQFVIGAISGSWGKLVSGIKGIIVPSEAATLAAGELAVAEGAVGVAAEGAAVSAGAAFAAIAASAALVLAPIAAVAFAFLVARGNARRAAAEFQKAISIDVGRLALGGQPAQAVRVTAQSAGATFAPVGPDLRSQHMAFVQAQFDADTAKAAVEQYDHALSLLSGTARDTTNSIAGTFKGMTDLTQPLSSVTDGVTLLNKTLSDAQGRLGSFARASGADVSSILAGISAVVNDEKSTIADVVAAYQDGIGKLRAANAAWHDSIVSAFGGAGTALDKFANRSDVSLGKAIGSLQHYTANIRTFGSNIATIQDRFGKDAQDFIQWASTQGLAQSGLVSAVASGNDQMAQSFIDNFNKANSATETLASQIQKALAPAFQGIMTWLKNVVRAIQGLPIIRPHVDNRDAAAALKVLEDKLRGLAGRHEILVHTTFTSTGGGAGTGGGGSTDTPWWVTHTGGHIMQPGVTRRMHGGGMGLASDEVPAILQRGEFVIRRSAVQQIGVPALQALNKLHSGGEANGLRQLNTMPSVVKVDVRVAQPQAPTVKLALPDRKRFTGALDDEVLADGHW